MAKQSYLLFNLGYACYGIPTSAVQELFFLPEITPVPEAPAFMVGVINLRGNILPVIDLQRRLGQPASPYQLSHSIIVLQWQTHQIGLLVHQIHEVTTIGDDQIRSDLMYEQWQAAGFQRFVSGIATLDATLVTLLSPEQLIQATSCLESDSEQDTRVTAEPALNQTVPPLFAHLSGDDQQVLQARSENLRQVVAVQDHQGIPVTVIRLGSEYFGLSLETIHEFTDIRKVTPIPCCPPHILGNINLRGEIVTLVDISQTVNLPIAPLSSKQKAIVVRFNEMVAGIAVDEILDVVSLDPAQISLAPTAIHASSDEYLQGVTPYRKHMISIINVSKILTSGVLIVDEDL